MGGKQRGEGVLVQFEISVAPHFSAVVGRLQRALTV